MTKVDHDKQPEYCDMTVQCPHMHLVYQGMDKSTWQCARCGHILTKETI